MIGVVSEKEEFQFMKKQIVALTAITGLFIGAANASAAEQSYTVQSGDTLWSIAQQNKVSVENLQEWNDLASDMIFPEQQLTLEKFKSYTVVSGDTLYSIAKAYGISVQDIKGWNGLTSDLILPGQVVFVEGNEYSAPKAVESSQAVNTSAGTSASNATTASAPAASQPVQSTQQTEAPAAARTLTVEATAYTAYCTGCSGTTATGIDLRSNPNQKVIAVDPNVIPLGSRVWVEGYGEAIAGDTGGAIKGNKIDVFIPNQQDALNWGRQTVTVKILD